MALDIARPLPKINKGNKYIHVDVDHYFKWCEIKTMHDHTIVITTKFWKKKLFVDMVYLSSFSLTMVVNGLWNFTIYVRSMTSIINTLHHSGFDVMVWPKDRLRQLSMASLLCPHFKIIQVLGTSNCLGVI
jgi:hypothetical protein